MYVPRIIDNNLSKYVDVSFLLKFILLMGSIYSFNVFYISMIDARGLIYFPYFDQHLNYFSVLRATILHTANFIVHCFGFQSYISDIYTLRLYNGPGIHVGLPCLGYGVMSFWIAFILAHNITWQKKLVWATAGMLFLWLLNCWRVALILMAVNKHWDINRWMDNHTLFNRIVYLLILLMVCGYYQISKRETAL